MFNTLEYAGNKIDRQEAVFEDGTIREQDGCTKLQLSLEQEQSIKSIRLYYKDGGSKEIDWSTYSKLVSNKEKKITVSKLETVEDEIPGEFELEWAQTESKEYHDLKDLDIDKYLGYIANRDGAVKENGHGLFGIGGNISMEDARAMAEDYQDSIIWTHIISIRGDDGDKTGFNNRNAWRDLVLAKAPNLAKIYNISLENLVVNAAYHQNTGNDHVHVIMYSKDKREGFVKGGKDGMKRATEKMKSLFLNDIFKGDVAPLKELITQQRTDIKDELKNHLVNISKSDITDGMMVNMFLSLSQDLSHHKGKFDYGYLKPELKIKVNDFLRHTLDSNENLSALFTELMGSKRAYIAMYNQDENKIESLVEEAKEKIFHPDKGQATLQNIIVHAIADYNNEKAIPLEKSSGRDNKTQDTPSHQNDVAVGLTDGATKGKNSAYAEDTPDANSSIFFDVPPPPKDKEEPLPTMDEFRNLGNLEESESLEPLPPGTKAPEDWYDLSEIRERIGKTLDKNKVSETTAMLFDDELELSDDELDFLSYDDSTPRLFDEELQWTENTEDYISVEVPQEEWNYVDNPQEEIKIYTSELEYTEKVTMAEVSHKAEKEKILEKYKALKNILQNEDSKVLLKSIYKDIKEAIYTELLSPDDNQVKEKLSHLQELAKELESCDYTNRSQLVPEVQNIICDIIEEIETPELTEYFEKLKEHLKLQVEESVPKEVQDDVLKLIYNMRNGVLYMPYNYIIFAMGTETKATYGKAVAWEMKEDIQNLNHLIYKNFYDILSHNKAKREASPVYQLIKQLINTPMPSNPKEKWERKQIHRKILAEFRHTPDFDKTYQKLENTFYQKLHDCCRIDNVSELFKSTVIDGDFGSINSTIEFMTSNTESVVARINRQKASHCVKLICGAIAYSLYNETNHQMQKNLSQKNTLSRGANRFITKKTNKQINQFLSY